MKLALALLLWPTNALAYSDGTLFARDPSADPAGGGGGIYFTGSPRFHALDCAVCHVGGPSDLSLLLSALEDGSPAHLFDDGYRPGAIYEIEVAFADDRLAPPSECPRSGEEPCNLDLFALEIVDGKGRPAGQLCAVEPIESAGTNRCAGCRSLRAGGTIVADDCSVVLADGFDDTAFGWRNGVTAYSFFWRAPAEDVGALEAYVSGVDGAGPQNEGDEATSYTGDGTVTLAVGLASPSAPIPKMSCEATPLAPDASILLLITSSFSFWAAAARRRSALRDLRASRRASASSSP